MDLASPKCCFFHLCLPTHHRLHPPSDCEIIHLGLHFRPIFLPHTVCVPSKVKKAIKIWGFYYEAKNADQ